MTPLKSVLQRQESRLHPASNRPLRTDTIGSTLKLIVVENVKRTQYYSIRLKSMSFEDDAIF